MAVHCEILLYHNRNKHLVQPFFQNWIDFVAPIHVAMPSAAAPLVTASPAGALAPVPQFSRCSEQRKPPPCIGM